VTSEEILWVYIIPMKTSVCDCLVGRGGNRTGWVRFGFGSDGSGQFDFLEEIGLGRVGSGSGRTGSGRVNIYIVFFQIVDRFRLD
jgi:hypothetical protein